MKIIYSVQYLRAFAAILVVYCHAIDRVGDSRQSNFYFLNNFGAIGVDVFFVLSGFIISIIGENISGGGESFLNFLKKRFIRINLIYYFITFIIICQIVLTNKLFNYNSLVKSITILPIFDFGKQFVSPILFIGWTLSFEWLFYVIYSILIGFSVLRRDVVLVCFLILLCILGLLFQFDNAHWIFITNPMVLEFAVGILIARIYKSSSIKLSKIVVYSVFFISIMMFMFLIFKGYSSISEADFILKGIGSWKRFFLWGIPSAMLVFGLIFIEKNNTDKFIKSKILLVLGDASYSIYLTHQLFLLIYLSVNKRIEILQNLNADVNIILLTFLAVVIGYFFHKFFEIPMLNYAKKKIN